MENHVKQLFAQASQATRAQGEPAVYFVTCRHPRLRFWQDELALLRAARSPRGVARFGYRVAKAGLRLARRKAAGLKRRLLMTLKR